MLASTTDGPVATPRLESIAFPSTLDGASLPGSLGFQDFLPMGVSASWRWGCTQTHPHPDKSPINER